MTQPLAEQETQTSRPTGEQTRYDFVRHYCRVLEVRFTRGARKHRVGTDRVAGGPVSKYTVGPDVDLDKEDVRLAG